MGFFDKAKALLGLGKTEEDDEASERAAPAAPASSAPRGALRTKNREGRPPLADPPPPSQSIDDALAAREAGDAAEARRILAEIDRGAGLRTVLRAAAALEAGDEGELAGIWGAVSGEVTSWKLLLELGAALADPSAAAAYVERARAANAPAWALSWTRATSADEATRRAGLVELLFADHALARTVAARDLAVPAVQADPAAAQRYAAFAHGRESIRRFGAPAVAALVDRVLSGRAARGKA
jgi:hypothetical protein